LFDKQSLSGAKEEDIEKRAQKLADAPAASASKFTLPESQIAGVNKNKAALNVTVESKPRARM
jgi:hypothetical protein